MGNRRDSDVGKLTLSDWESDLRRKVAVMRELGVASADGIILGPPPMPKAEVERIKSDPLYEKRGHYENLFMRAVGDAELKRLPDLA